MGVGEPTKILFGTDGWRAKIGDEFTFENVRRLAEGVARVVEQDGATAKGVVIAYDRRFGSEDFAVTAAEMLLAHNIPVAYAATAVPTQMASYEVVERGAAMGVVITASHNPWMDNGFKVKAPSGAAAGPELLKRIETEIAATRGPELIGRPFADAEAAGLVARYDPYPGYKKFVERNLDLARLAAQPLSIMVDPVYGAGAGWIGRLLAGGKLRVTEMRSERNPWFGGVNPEPIRPHIDPVLDAMRGGAYDLGLLLDGLNDDIFKKMNDVDFPVTDVLDGIAAAQEAGFTNLKVNMVVKKGTNDQEIVGMAKHFKGSGVTLRFIEFMDVGSSNGWDMSQVLPSQEVADRINALFPIEPIEANYPGEVAQRWRYVDGSGEIGFISSVTQTFCHECTRARISTDGQLYLCLFANEGFDFKTLLRSGRSDLEIANAIMSTWSGRNDHYSEIRGSNTAGSKSSRKVEMSYIGG